MDGFSLFFLLLELLELFILLPYLLLLQNNDFCERSKRFVLSKVPLVYFNVLYKHVGVCRKIALYLYKLCSKKSFLNVVNEKKKTEACVKIHATLLDDVFSFFFYIF